MTTNTAATTDGKRTPVMPTPVEGCPTCWSAGGVYACPKHSPNPLVREWIPPFNMHIICCPWCGGKMLFEGYKVEKEEKP